MYELRGFVSDWLHIGRSSVFMTGRTEATSRPTRLILYSNENWDLTRTKRRCLLICMTGTETTDSAYWSLSNSINE